MRYYSLQLSDGSLVQFASVTTIIDQINQKGYAGKPLWKYNLEEGRARGERVHGFVHRFLLTGEQLSPAEFGQETARTQNGMRAFTRWWMGHRPFKVKHIEYTIYHLEEMYAGTIDLVADFQTPEPRVFIHDWKTGDPKNLEENHFMQMGAYFLGYKFQHPRRKLDGAYINYLDTHTGLYSEKFMCPDECIHWGNEFIRLKKEIGMV